MTLLGESHHCNYALTSPVCIVEHLVHLHVIVLQSSEQLQFCFLA